MLKQVFPLMGDGAMYIVDYGQVKINMARTQQNREPYEYVPGTKPRKDAAAGNRNQVGKCKKAAMAVNSYPLLKK